MAKCSDRQLVIAEWCRQRVPHSWTCNGEATRGIADCFLWLGRRGCRMQLIVGIGGWGYGVNRDRLTHAGQIAGDILCRQLYTRTHVLNSTRWLTGCQCRMSQIVDDKLSYFRLRNGRSTLLQRSGLLTQMNVVSASQYPVTVIYLANCECLAVLNWRSSSINPSTLCYCVFLSLILHMGSSLAVVLTFKFRENWKSIKGFQRAH